VKIVVRCFVNRAPGFKYTQLISICKQVAKVFWHKVTSLPCTDNWFYWSHLQPWGAELHGSFNSIRHPHSIRSFLGHTSPHRAFPAAGPTIWNSLPDNVISAPSLSIYRQRLKHFCSRPRSLILSLIPGKLFPTSSGSWSDFITWTTLKIIWLINWLIDWLAP